MKIFSIGHSTRGIDAFTDLLNKAGADCVVDVRRFPHSPRHPHFDIACLPPALARAGLGYVHMPALGGRRPPGADDYPARHGLWKQEGLRNYACYAETPAFAAALRSLLRLARTASPALMCAEGDWRQCHRRIIVDYVLAAGCEVAHISAHGATPAKTTPGALTRPGGFILYSDAPLLTA